MMIGMMQKFQDVKAKVEASKERLNSVYLQEKSNDDLLKAEITANHEIKKIEFEKHFTISILMLRCLSISLF